MRRLWFASIVVLGVATAGYAADPAPPKPAPAEPAASPAAPKPAAPKPAAPAATDKPAPPPSAGQPGEEDTAELILGKAPPPLPREPRPAASPGFEPPHPGIEDFRNLPYPQSTYLGAKYLQLDPGFVYGIQEGLEFVYLRKYSQARDHFAAVETAYPGTAARAIGDTLVWQALMLENFDFKYDKQYWTSSKEAKKQLSDAISAPGADSWDHLAMAAVTGIESIHTMRQGSYVNALQLAFSAIDEIEKCRAAAPEFIDLKLADGLYNYWRTVVTQGSKVLPDFGDHRPEGIEQMTTVQDTGVFVKPLASFALAFTWLEERDYHRATVACVKNRVAYPDNIVNNLTCGQIYTYDRNFPEALEVFDKVSAVDPNNSRVHYLRGWTLLKSGGDLAKAQSELTTYLQTPYLEPYQRSYALLRLGQVYARQDQFSKAAENYEAAVKVDGNKEAKSALDKLAERKKDGKIDY
jgi:tetratricopeptide (TPR) repeat protein